MKSGLPLTSAYLNSGWGGSTLSKEALTSQAPPLAPLAEYRGVPKPAESMSWVCPRASALFDMPETPLHGGIQEGS